VPSPHPSLFPGLNFTPNFLLLLPLSSAGGWGVGVVVSSSHIVSTAPSSSGGGLFTLCPCSSVGYLPRETVLHELLQRGPFPWGAVLQEQAVPAWVPTGSQVLPANLLQCGLSTWSQPPPGIPLLRRGVLPGLQVGLCSLVGLHGLQGHSLSHHGLLQGNLCSSAWSTSCPSFCTDRGVCRVGALT